MAATAWKDNLQDYVIIGAGVMGASIFKEICETEKDAKVLILESVSSKNNPQSSSRGKARRIGLLELSASLRTLHAWHEWNALHQQAIDEGVDGGILDATGDVVLISIFPFGWVLIIVFLIWFFTSILLSKLGFERTVPSSFQILFSSGLKKLLPGFKIGAGTIGLYYKEAASLHAERCVQFLISCGVKAGGKLQDNSPVQSVNLVRSGGVKETIIKIKTPKEEIYAKHVIVAAGGWSGEVLKDLNLGIGREMEKFTYLDFECDNSKWSAEENLPIYMYLDDNIFGFPSQGKDGDRGLQVKTSLGKVITDLDNTKPYQKAVDHIQDWAERVLGISKQTKYTECNCHYAYLTMDGKRRQICDYIPKTNKKVILCAGFGGWGFKFGSIIGKEVVGVLKGEAPPLGLEWKANQRESWIMKTLHELIHTLSHATVEP